jgi:hypothetical protein
MERPQKITFAEMRESGVTASLIYCSDFRCCHSVEMLADQWANDVRLSDIEPRFVCSTCGRRGADVSPHPGWGKRSRGY